MATVKRDSLEMLLNRVKRPQNIGGKPQDQVHSCILRMIDGRMSVTSLVKDGVSSVGRFSCAAIGDDDTYYISDINTFLGVLKYHGTDVTLDGSTAEKLRVKSSNKQTTLTGSAEAMAYPHSPKTLADWEAQSMQVASSLTKVLQEGLKGNWVYHMKDGTQRKAIQKWVVSATELFEALRCDSMNGQKINRYTFYADVDKETLQVEVGKNLKGKTRSDLSYEECMLKHSSFTTTFEGGLEQLMSTVGGNVDLFFFDFTKEGQGRKLLIDFGNEDFVFQGAIQ